MDIATKVAQALEGPVIQAVNDIVAAFKLDPAYAQRLIDNDGAAYVAARDALTALFGDLLALDAGAMQVTESRYGYRSGYTIWSSSAKSLDARTRDVVEQVQCLKRMYRSLLKDATVGVTELHRLSGGVEKYFAVPNLWKKDSRFTGTYTAHVRLMLECLSSEYGQNTMKYVRLLDKGKLQQTARAEGALKRLSEKQKHPDILVIPAQFGLLYRGNSVYRALNQMLDFRQFPLGVFVVGNMLLTHPERLRSQDDLSIDCAGDTHFIDVGGRWSGRVLHFLHRYNQLELVEYQADEVVCGAGSPSGFFQD